MTLAKVVPSGLTCAVHSMGEDPIYGPGNRRKVEAQLSAWCRTPRRPEPQAGGAAGRVRGKSPRVLQPAGEGLQPGKGLGGGEGSEEKPSAWICGLQPRVRAPPPLLRLLRPRPSLSHSQLPKTTCRSLQKPGASFCPPDSAFSHFFCLFLHLTASLGSVPRILFPLVC